MQHFPGPVHSQSLISFQAVLHLQSIHNRLIRYALRCQIKCTTYRTVILRENCKVKTVKRTNNGTHLRPKPFSVTERYSFNKPGRDTKDIQQANRILSSFPLQFISFVLSS